jgi:hypothetical protein
VGIDRRNKAVDARTEGHKGGRERARAKVSRGEPQIHGAASFGAKGADAGRNQLGVEKAIAIFKELATHAQSQGATNAEKSLALLELYRARAAAEAPVR